MATSAEKPLDWIKQIERFIFELEEKPQFGLPNDFDWQGFEKRLQEAFGRPSLKIEYRAQGWRSGDERWAGLGEDLLPLPVEWAPLQSPAYFLTNEQDLKWLMADLLGGEKEAAYFYDLSLVQGFYHYFAAEMLQTLDQLDFAPPLAPRLGEILGEIQETIGESPCFVIDVSCSVNGQTFWGKVLLTEGFRQEWKRFFSNLPPPALSRETQEKIHLDVGLEVGYTQLQLREWKEVRRGDFILLDHCSYDPAVKKGGVVLSLDQKPLFRGRFKEQGIKLTEYPKYEEVSLSMDEQPFSDHPHEDFESEDLYGDEHAEELEDFGEEEKEEREVQLAPSESSISPEELPIQLTVEVGRLRMTAKELMTLAPGNLLEVNVAPEQGVDLVINGKKVGRGELIRIGETLGVRILSL
ncbi:MAG: type III secretion system cytoplasmic ring protein SctQ [Chlamydiales bacterium]|nr:type III secretion system cytoplasmic ring protein SctQ [Chlamydiales bacterium]